jgi:hypothetical protein
VYLNGFLSLASDKNAGRLFLIRESLSADSMIELLQEWAWLNEIGMNSALKLRLWFQLSYRELAEIFGVSVREMNQILRNQRASLLSPYRPESTQTGEFSCFMVEQHLGTWIDGEVEETKTLSLIARHLQECEKCTQRLQEYRDLNSKILSERNHELEISEEEWESAIRYLRRARRTQLIRILLVAFIVVVISALIAWAIFSKPDKMPNIYEITN